jgi:hypothetical protein
MAKKLKEKTDSTSYRDLTVRHLKIGWIGLLVFLSMGIFLEALHGLKLGLYLDVQNTTRRLMWTLAHSHGALFALIQIAFACSLTSLTGRDGKLSSAVNFRTISRCLTGAIIFLPLGFFLGGVWMFDGDPGPGIFLVPLGAVLMLIAVVQFVSVIRKL